jgi:hypothetical protein
MEEFDLYQIVESQAHTDTDLLFEEIDTCQRVAIVLDNVEEHGL